MSAQIVDAPAAGGVAAESAPGADPGLLTRAERMAILQDVLGDGISEAQVAAAVDALSAAEAERWEQLPPDIDPDMGFNYHFLSCTETCWLGRQVLVEGRTFRIFRAR